MTQRTSKKYSLTEDLKARALSMDVSDGGREFHVRAAVEANELHYLVTITLKDRAKFITLFFP